MTHVGGMLCGVLLLVAAATGSRAGQSSENPFAGDADAIAEGRQLLDAVCGGYCHSTTEGLATMPQTCSTVNGGTATPTPTSSG